MIRVYIEDKVINCYKFKDDTAIEKIKNQFFNSNMDFSEENGYIGKECDYECNLQNQRLVFINNKAYRNPKIIKLKQPKNVNSKNITLDRYDIDVYCDGKQYLYEIKAANIVTAILLLPSNHIDYIIKIVVYKC
jgi:hypothetical protein